MLSRVADAVYWMSRNIERAENVARFVDVTLHLILDLPEGAEEQWLPLVMTTGDQVDFTKRYGPATRRNVIKFLIFDREYHNSILSCILCARENARSIRETIASEMWEHLNHFYYRVVEAGGDFAVREAPQEFLNEVKVACQLFYGITDTIMSHNEGWHFANLGRLLERADKTSRMLDVKYFSLLQRGRTAGTPDDDLHWSAVLRSVSGFEMYRKRHHGITPERVVNFLVLDRDFPRAAMFCIDEAWQSMQAISGGPSATSRNPAEQLLHQLREDMLSATVGDIVSQGLHPFIDRLQTRLNEVGAGIHQTFIAMRPEELAGTP